MAPPAHTGSLALLACCGFSLFVAVREHCSVDRGASKLGAPEVRPPRLHRSFKSSCDNAELNDHESQRHCRNKNEEYAVSCALRFLLQQCASLAASCVGIPYCMPRVVTASLSDRQNCRVTFRDKFQQLLIYAS
jgi:hypothetical protein